MPKSTDKSNAKVAARIVQGWALNDANDPHAREALEGRIESALTTCQSKVAGKVLAKLLELSEAYRVNYDADALRGISAVEASLEAMFTRLGIPVDEGAE